MMADSPSWRAPKSQTILDGTVKVVKESYGFIKPDQSLPVEYTNKDVFFSFRSLCDCDVDFGDKVRFVLDEHPKDRPQASKVFLGDNVESEVMSRRLDGNVKTEPAIPSDIGPAGGDTMPNPKSQNRVSKLQRQGRIIKVSDDATGFVKILGELPDQFKGYRETLFFNSNWVQPACISLIVGDLLEFDLGVNKKRENELWAHRIRLIKCAERTDKEIHVCLRRLAESVQNEDTDSDGIVLQMLRCDSLWKCIGGCTNLSTFTIIKLFDLLEMISDHSKTSKQIFQHTLEVLMSTEFGKSKRSCLKQFILDAWENEQLRYQKKIKTFLLMILDCLPSRAKLVANLVKGMLRNSNDMNTEQFLFSIIQKLSTGCRENVGDLDWNEVPLVPSANELISSSKTQYEYLRQVKTHGPYESVHDYVDTYFRLLREDCFSSLRTGVQKYLNNSLDPRDMNIYTNISLARVSLTSKGNGMMLGLKVTPYKTIQNWRTCTNLLFGNLLCLSPTGSFTDAIWATVSERDTDLLESEGVIWVELITDSNQQDDTDCITILKDGANKTVMAESPTYYVAYQPVLEALQISEPDELPFQTELVGLQPPQQPETLVSTSILVSSKMDESQGRAFKQALRQRIGIIQGPPGTGKTFIGIKLVRHFLRLKSYIKGPIIVLTYKNHALDEFTKAVLEFIPEDVVRIGGRSRDTELQHCNLQTLKMSHSMSKENASERQTIQAEASALKRSLQTLLKQFGSAAIFTAENVLDVFCIPQIETLLLGCKSELRYPAGDNVWKVADRKMIKDTLSKYNESIHTEKVDKKQHDGAPRKDLLRYINQVLKQWLPIKAFEDIIKVEEGLNNLSALKSSPEKAPDETSDTESLLTDVDETDVAEEMAERLASLTFQGANHRGDDVKLEQSKQTWNVPFIPSIAKRWASQVSIQYLGQIQDLWQLANYDRALVVQLILWNKREKVETELKEAMLKYKELLAILQELDNQHEVSILKEKKVIAMTITGASLRHKLLRLLKPAIILVEEAAEVLEPQIMAVLGSWVKHLILIGDHKQLRPSVESYTLAKDYHLDLSMMERLINNNYPYATLQMQNRMLPEMADLLKDIYPELQNNLQQVSMNTAPNFVPSIFFWSHEDAETHERSYSNVGEAKRVIKLALLFLTQGYEEHEISILAAYRGQVKLLRQMLAKAKEDHPSIIDGAIKVNTIDMFQGDENNIIIVSLIRSNKQGQIGFLKTINRRCVAQSRARCGMYFVGNATTFQMAKDSCWTNVIKKLEKCSQTGPQIPLHCPKHLHVKGLEARTADDIPLTGLCKRSCVHVMDCGIHRCKEICQPFHTHDLCVETVEFVHKECGHPAKRKCWQTESSVFCRKPCDSQMMCFIHPCPSTCQPPHSHLKALCKVPMPYTFPECGHPMTKLCGELEKQLLCRKPCIKLMDCRLHGCKEKCQPKHAHPASDCADIVTYQFPGCGHTKKKNCGADGSKLRCSEPCQNLMECGKHKCQNKCQPEHSHHICLCAISVPYNFPKCGHLTRKKCGEDISVLCCSEPCEQHMDCGIHKCPSKCQPEHSHNMSLCTKTVQFKFKCGHKGNKKCGEDSSRLLCPWPCQKMMECGVHKCQSDCNTEHSHAQSLCDVVVNHKLNTCSHTIQKKCGQEEMELCCSEPCGKLMDCKHHQCSNPCMPEHSHSKSLCNIPVHKKLDRCGHTVRKRCGAMESEVTCKEQCKKHMDCGLHLCPSKCQPDHPHSKELCNVSVHYKLKRCGHTVKKKCGEDESGVSCSQLCKELMDCGLHKCTNNCLPQHSHIKTLCKVPIKHKLELCGHMMDKECGEDAAAYSCKLKVQVKLKKCQHDIVCECWQVGDTFRCKESCMRKLPCGHPCEGLCGDPCGAGNCWLCGEQQEVDRKNKVAAEGQEKERARERAKQELLDLMKNNPYLTEKCHRQILLPDGDSASEFIDVCDRVQKYVQPLHNWFPEVKQIEKITNLKLYEQWLQVKSQMFDPTRAELKFHGTGIDAIEGIIKDGFQLPSTNGMYGGGIYFATDSSKSAQEKYTRRSNKLLLCDVLLGKSLTVDSAKPTMKDTTLKMLGYDSLYAKRETKGKGGVLFDEYVVYNPDQALPRYIISYGQSSLAHMNLWVNVPKTLQHRQLLPKRQYDPNDPLDFHFRLAESQFLRLMQHRSLSAQVKSVDFYQNPELIGRFNDKETEFKLKYPVGEESKPILAFHGTPAQNIDSIVKTNFSMQMNRRGAYGAGIYFSEFPDVSIGYAKGATKLILCQILPGRPFPCHGSMQNAPLQSGYDSHIVQADAHGRGQMVVIFDPDQVTPTYVINF